MKAKHPERKREITPLTEEELGKDRKQMSRKVFDETLRHLDHDVAPGLCCLRNEHLTALQFHKDRQVLTEAHAATTHLFNFGNNVVTNALPRYFYTAYLATRLVPANKDDPADLPEGKTPDCIPVKIGGSN